MGNEKKWDLTLMFKNDEEFDLAIKKINDLLGKLVAMKGHILDNSDTLLEFFKIDEELDKLHEKAYVYAHLAYDTNMDDEKCEERRNRIDKLTSEVSSSESFINPEMFSKELDYVLKLLDEKEELKKYKFRMERWFRSKKYVLSDAEEKIMSSIGEVFSSTRDTYSSLNNIDVSFGYIKDENNKKVELTTSNYSIFIESKNSKVRKNAFVKLHEFYKNHINTLSSLYTTKIKQDAFVSKIRGYDSIIDLYLYGDKIDKKLYETLLSVTSKNVKPLQKYYKIKAKYLGVKKMHLYDTYVNISSVPDKKYEYDESTKIVLDGLNVLGDDYINKLKGLINSNVIDVYPKKAKRSGAYQWGAYGYIPYVLLNYKGTVSSNSTMAHELGHAMHSLYSDSNNEYCYAGYPIFLAEIASTVNEVLLSNYLYNNTNDKDEKIYYTVDLLDKFKATVYRQTMFAEFEYEAHKMYENNVPVTKEALCNLYYNLYKKQFGNSLILDYIVRYEWARIPHFYTPFYVYKYSTGYISALIIADKLMSNEPGFKEKYIEFLSSGGKDYPLNILSKLGIDINDEKVIKSAFNIFNEKVNLLEELLEGE